MSLGIERTFAKRINDSVTALDNLRREYKELSRFVVSDELYDEGGKKYSKAVEKFSEWTVEPSPVQLSQADQQALPFNTMPSPQNPMLPLAPQSASPKVPQGYPAAIVLSIAFLGIIFLAYSSYREADVALFLGIGALGLYFLPAIIDKIAHLTAGVTQKRIEGTTVADLFEEASKMFMETLYMTNDMAYTASERKLEDDLVAQKQMETTMFLQNTFRKIFVISEREWNVRAHIKEGNAIKLASGSGGSMGTPNSDILG